MSCASARLDIHRRQYEKSCALCSAVAYCCGAVAPRAIAALLGRFLPRLGPLAHCQRAFFLFVRKFGKSQGNRERAGTDPDGSQESVLVKALFRGGLEWPEVVEWHGRERIGKL